MSSVKEMEHIDWSGRMRIIMGVAYCLQYMHHDLNPPLAHTHLSSHAIFLTDDYAAKVISFTGWVHSILFVFLFSLFFFFVLVSLSLLSS